MEEKIKRVCRVLSRCYMLFWIVPIVIVAAGEFGWIDTGVYADNFSATYLFEFFGILLTATLVPVSLKLFHWTLMKHIDKLLFVDALRKYGLMCIVRIGLLAVVVVFNLIGYYLTLSTSCILCGCIGLAASLFCVPGDHRLRLDLHLISEEK
jgi:hypothetical protein